MPTPVQSVVGRRNRLNNAPDGVCNDIRPLLRNGVVTPSTLIRPREDNRVMASHPCLST
ncbi:hypothetical protein ACFSC4_20240 [Deinococcus malanensis]|uniref:hypothetical protein n=1 Tax=Deinococcus malanensis TaxID=1706855 RepID=UPI00363BF5E9